MNSDEAQESMAGYLEAFKTRSLEIALAGFEEIGARAATLLQKNELLEPGGSLVVSEPLINAIKDPRAAHRVQLPPGPLVMIDEAAGGRTVCEVAVLMINEAQEVRSAALDYLLAQASSDTGTIGSRVNELMAREKPRILSNEAKVWQTASITAMDALHGDFLLNVAGSRQSLQARFDDGVNDFLRRALRPSLQCLNSLEFPAWSPLEQAAEISADIETIVMEAASLLEALENYRSRLGFLPIGRPFAASRVVSLWRERRQTSPEVWPEVWEWARSSRGVTAKYHACEVFVSSPELVPDGCWSDLWAHIVSVVTAGRDDTEGGESEQWKTLIQAAQHYCFYIESYSPGGDSRAISSAAWYLADRLSGAFADSEELARKLREHAVGPEIELSSQVWQLSRAPVRGSQIRYATLGLRSMWSQALLVRIAERLPELQSSEATEDQRDAMTTELALMALGGFPLPEGAEPPEGLAYEGSAVNAVRSWQDAFPAGEDATRLDALLEVATKLSVESEFKQQVKNLAEATSADRTVVIHQLRAKCYCGNAPAEVLWECISMDSWRRALLQDAEPEVLDPLLDALLESRGSDLERWRRLPHLFATEAETCEEAERRELLFGATVCASFATDTVSALDRMLRGQSSGMFAGYAEFWRERINAIRKRAPAWIAGRARRILSALRPIA